MFERSRSFLALLGVLVVVVLVCGGDRYGVLLSGSMAQVGPSARHVIAYGRKLCFDSALCNLRPQPSSPGLMVLPAAVKEAGREARRKSLFCTAAQWSWRTKRRRSKWRKRWKRMAPISGALRRREADQGAPASPCEVATLANDGRRLSEDLSA